MKHLAGLVLAFAMMGCANQPKESVFPPDTSADAAACREEAMRDPALSALRHSIYVEYQAQVDRLNAEINATQRRSYFDCMAQRGHVRRGGVERIGR